MTTIKPEKEHLASDLLAGLTFALVNIPQSMAHALLATVNPVFGLYTLMLATGFVRGIPAGASSSGSALVVSVGARTRWAHIFGGLAGSRLNGER
jgi:SulP family sulfate permease